MMDDPQLTLCIIPLLEVVKGSCSNWQKVLNTSIGPNSLATDISAFGNRGVEHYNAQDEVIRYLIQNGMDTSKIRSHHMQQRSQRLRNNNTPFKTRDLPQSVPDWTISDSPTQLGSLPMCSAVPDNQLSAVRSGKSRHRQTGQKER